MAGIGMRFGLKALHGQGCSTGGRSRSDPNRIGKDVGRPGESQGFPLGQEFPSSAGAAQAAGIRAPTALRRPAPFPWSPWPAPSSHGPPDPPVVTPMALRIPAWGCRPCGYPRSGHCPKPDSNRNAVPQKMPPLRPLRHISPSSRAGLFNQAVRASPSL